MASSTKKDSEIDALLKLYFNTFASNSFVKSKISQVDVLKYCVDNDVTVIETKNAGKISLNFDVPTQGILNIKNFIPLVQASLHSVPPLNLGPGAAAAAAPAPPSPPPGGAAAAVASGFSAGVRAGLHHLHNLEGKTSVMRVLKKMKTALKKNKLY